MSTQSASHKRGKAVRDGIRVDPVRTLPLVDALERIRSGPDGLTSAEAKARAQPHRTGSDRDRGRTSDLARW